MVAEVQCGVGGVGGVSTWQMEQSGEVGKGSKNILLGLVSAIVGDIYRIVSAVLLLRPKG